MTADLSNPIINSPYDPPEAPFEIGPNGPTGQILPGSRPSESYIPVPVSKKGRQAVQPTLDFDITGERREQNSLINDIRPASAVRPARASVIAGEMSTACTEATSGARAVVTNPVPAPRSTQISDGCGCDKSRMRSSTFPNAAAEIT